MTTRSAARHRQATRPLTPFNSLAPATRRSLAVAASSGLAITMLASGANAAGSSPQAAASAGSLQQGVGLGALSTQVRDAFATNAEFIAADVTVLPEDVSTTAVEVDVETVEEKEAAAAAAAEAAAAAQRAEAAAAQREAANNQASAQNAAAAQQAQPQQAQAPAQAAPAPAAANPSGNSIVALALQHVGKPYVMGATGPNAFDCSGLVQYVYGQAGISLPRTSYAQGAAGTRVSAAQAQPGDIVYYGGHVGIYAGNGMMIDAGNPSTGVVHRAVYGSPSYIRVA